jgi:hypothetical protein
VKTSVRSTSETITVVASVKGDLKGRRRLPPDGVLRSAHQSSCGLFLGARQRMNLRREINVPETLPTDLESDIDWPIFKEKTGAERRCSMMTIKPGDQVVSMSPDGEAIEVYTVHKVLPDGIQAEGASGKLFKSELRTYSEDTVKQIKEMESRIKAIKGEIKSLYGTLGEIR